MDTLEPASCGGAQQPRAALEQNGARRGALEEYRAAYTVDPKNSIYKQNYERLLQRVNQ
jgi:hypothetical protein